MATATLTDYLATSTQKVFQIKFTQGNKLSSQVYFGNVEKHDDVFNREMPINRGCLQTDKGIIHPLYESSTILFHGLGARRHRYPYAKSDDYQHIYHGMTQTVGNVPQHLPNNGLSSIAKAGDAIYGLNAPSDVGHYYINDTMYEWLAQDNGYAFPKSFPYKTYLYRDDVKDAIDLTSLSTTVDTVVSGIKYNTLFEIPGGLYSDYSSGSMFATTVKTKNQYNSKYNMNGDRSRLKQVREYLGIFSNNNQVYLKYRDRSKSTGAYTFSSATRQNNIDFRTATLQNPTLDDKDQEQIEVIENLNRGVEPAKHKSTLYKLKLTAPFINELDSDSELDKIQLKENVRQELRNVIRSLAERVAPANAQLFNVEINDDLTEYQDMTYIKVVLDAGEGSGGFIRYYCPGDVITLPVPVYPGYDFAEWRDVSSGQPYTKLYSVGSNDVTLSAVWNAKRIYYTFNDKYGNRVQLTSGNYGDSIAINDVVKDSKFQISGYTFLSSFQPDSYKIEKFGPEDQTYTALYEPNIYEAAYDNLFKFIEWDECGQSELSANSSTNKKYSYSVNKKTGVYQIGLSSSAANINHIVGTKSRIETTNFSRFAMVLSTGVEYQVDYESNVAANQLYLRINYKESDASSSSHYIQFTGHTITLPHIEDGLQTVFADMTFIFRYNPQTALSCNTLRLSNIRVFPKADLSGITYPELRKVYRYSETGTYQTLPEPVSKTKTFVGWYRESEQSVRDYWKAQFGHNPEFVGKDEAKQQAIDKKVYEYKNSQRITELTQLPAECHTLYSYWT